MFFKQVRRNAAKNRKGNGLLFGSLVVAIIAFYTLLSLETQDVICFLATMESDAIQKLLKMLQIVYLISLFFVFFLVYFACKYQTDSRRREFGMYLMLGMKRSRLFLTLFCETFWNSLVSLGIGLPAALLLTEGISMATAKWVGLGIIGHRFSVSPGAILWTVCGFVIVQIVSMLVICIPLGKEEAAQLLHSNAAKKQVRLSQKKSAVFFFSGILLLLIAYYLGIFQLKRLEITIIFGLLLSGILGTFFLYKGLGGFLGRRIRRKQELAKGLETFTGRQVQEQVIGQYKALSIASLLLLIAISCTSYGISIGLGRTAGARSTDFSIFGSSKEITAFLEQDDIREKVKASYPMYLSMVKRDLDLKQLKNALASIPGSDNIVEYAHVDYVIAESSYNNMRKAMGKAEIKLNPEEVAFYTSEDRNYVTFYEILEQALKKGASIGIQGEDYGIRPELFYDNIVADRSITLYMALIVPDTLYREIARESVPYCQNVHLADAVIEERGLMQAVQEIDQKLADTGLKYDSYLTGMGRNLFYSVGASYLTIYLGILFFLIANTVIGLKYLIGQRQNKSRYHTLFALGAGKEEACSSVKKQIQLFFSLALGVSVINSVAAVVTLFSSVTRLPVGTSVGTVSLLAGAALFAFVLMEGIYIRVVKRMACREIRALH